jgi:hypothetical protein
MRVSKVKVTVNNKDTMVLMHRSAEKGALIYDTIDKKDRTEEIIPQKKQKSFELSIQNKTLLRYEAIKKQKLDRSKYKVVEDIFKYRKLPAKITLEDILPFLNHKFHLPVKYQKEGQWVQFELSTCILQAVEHQNLDELHPYYDWSKWYINDKSGKLKKSITNNHIQIGDGESKRQKALLMWETDFTDKGELDLETYHEKFIIDTLAASLRSVEKGELRDNGTPKETNSYHRNLKKVLQNHQALIFGRRETPNQENRDNKQLAIYNLEVVKYLEHYFPIKSNVRKNSAADIVYYLKSETIKSTVTHQLENAMRANLLRKGKYQHHDLKADATSENLTNLKRDEAFVMNLITTSAFAANNIRNIIDPEQIKDIVGKDDFIRSLKKDAFNKHIYGLFFPVGAEMIEPVSLWAMRGAVQQIRNNVAHYKKDALATIFNITKFEYPGAENILFSNTIYKQFFEKELEQLPEAFALQLKSGGVLAQYGFDQLKFLLDVVKFHLCRTVVPFAPGFKKVMKGGTGYQNSKQDESFYNLELTAYQLKDDFSEEAWSGRYFLLKIIYNYLFLPEFTNNDKVFADTVAWLLGKNRQQAQSSKNKNAYAFADIRLMESSESITDYMAYVQSQWIMEENKKEDDKKEDTRINFEKFVLQLFVKGFDTFMKQSAYQFINTPQPQINPTDTNQQQADKLKALEKKICPFCHIQNNKIDPAKDEQIAFYVYCKLLDANHLSTLRNELIKYRAASESELFIHLTEIIELCLLHADNVPADYWQIYKNKEQCLQRLQPFIAENSDYTNWGDLYVQTDDETPVVHSGIELSVKYGTASLLEKLIASDAKFKITENEFDLWHNARATIEAMIKKREEYHNLWLEAKEKDDNEKKTRIREKNNYARRFVETKGEDYIDICDYIDRYNWLNNKLHFEHLKSLQNITIEMLGRMAGFVVLWERDFQYLDQQRVKQQGGALMDFSHGVPKYEELKPHDAYFKRLFLCNNYSDTRNHIAHFNYLTKSAANYSLIDLINQLRELLHYDRKLKNAVAKTFIDLFDKHGMVLKLKFDSQMHQLQVGSITSKIIFHLGTKKESDNIYTFQVPTAYCNMCKQLLEMKN